MLDRPAVLFLFPLEPFLATFVTVSFFHLLRRLNLFAQAVLYTPGLILWCI